MTQRKPTDSTSQADKFRDLARQLQADEDPAHFEETLKKIATKTPPTSKPDDQ